eukprot:CAMPEP_0197703838 /NCGR_PEP_ID=MMETSP1338-20131121/125638_1 /TAXON_ID=43686 ORGANISM="Pelagodinium beii, Strain RCC1491" /NCGR_SAMPLE_ID=MMETSP1338 /ASSEMBLY_ACC=CAM_ASM_000754 /LENGTH=534 /DNA_ID=CAMNT_0043287737 /DNA_START=68 /DNA_END=1673 /DNA_ORIENTATION=+
MTDKSEQKVQPEESPPTFKKPLRALTAWDAAYVKRKAEVGEKFFTCKSGRQFCYFTDGAADPSQDDVAVVLCLHGANQNKVTWLQAEPLTKIFQIVPDRFGTMGSSSTPPEGYSFADGCKEFLELVDGVYAERNIPQEKKFFVTGHSMGGTWTIEMAACPDTCHRIEAIAPISSPSDVHHPNFSTEDLKKMKELPGFMKGLKKKGCGGAVNRCMFYNLFFKMAGCKNKGRTGDYGMAAQYELLREHTGGDERGRKAMDADPFFLTQSLDSFRGAATSQDAFNDGRGVGQRNGATTLLMSKCLASSTTERKKQQKKYGGTWTIEMAACPGVCERIEAIAPISSPSDVHHPNFSRERMKKLKELPGFMKGLKKKGCCGAFNRCIFFQMFNKVANCNSKGRTGDYGMAAAYELLREHTGGDERGRKAMDADPFFLTQSVDSFRGFTTPQDSFNEWSRCWSEEWSYDIADVKVPCFIYNGEAETTEVVHAEFIQNLIKGSELILWPGHGHLSISMEYRRILEALVKKQKVEGGPGFST